MLAGTAGPHRKRWSATWVCNERHRSLGPDQTFTIPATRSRSAIAGATGTLRAFRVSGRCDQFFRTRRSRRSLVKSATSWSSAVPAAAISSCIFSPATRGASRSAWPRHGRDVNANRRAVPRNGDGRFRFQVVRQVLTKLTDSYLGGLHCGKPRLRTQR